MTTTTTTTTGLTERELWLAWSQVEGVGPITLKRIYQHFGDLQSAWVASPQGLQAVEGIGAKLAAAIAQQRPQLAQAQAPAAPYLTPADADYPALLFEIPDPPPVLYYRGNLTLLAQCQSHPAVGIVGTRSPSEYGRRWTRRISAALAQAGITVVSGLADGIDREAHDSCLQRQGNTIGVLGTGVDVVYPRQNRDLYAAIAQRGLLLSEYPPGTPPDRSHFPRRNRIIAGLSRATLVAEAPVKSGALITARLANDYGRDVYALPGALDNPRCRGCLELVNQGAQLVLGPETLVQALGEIPTEPATSSARGMDTGTDTATAPPPTAPPPNLDPTLQRVWTCLQGETLSLDMVVVQSKGLSTGEVLSSLTQLELLGLVNQIPGGRYQRT
jgi:DNA processing protein